jgi:hypothetical protein
LTLGDAATQVGTAAAIGAGAGAVIHGATHVPPALFKIMPASVQQRWAGRMRVGEGGPLLKDVLADMDNRELSTFARSTIGERMTPDETAAANVLERNQDLGEASPFVAGPAGDAAQSGPLDLSRAGVPHDIVDFLKAKGLDDAHAYGIAAGIAAEARGGDHTAVNPKSGAMGLGQWLGSRKAELIRRYGANPSRAQQLEFLWHELNGGDPGGAHVLAAKDAGSVLDAYIRKFMRPAAGAETIGDLDRGMAALGHKGELPESAAIGAGEDDALAALRRDADQAGCSTVSSMIYGWKRALRPRAQRTPYSAAAKLRANCRARPSRYLISSLLAAGSRTSAVTLRR